MFFDRVLMQVEVKVCRAYGARTMLGNRCPSPGRAGLTFGGRPYGPQSPDRFLEKHSQDGPAELQIPRLRSSGFPVEVGGFLELHAPFLTERRTRCRVRCCVTGNPGRDDKGKGVASMCIRRLVEGPAVKSLIFSGP